VRDVRHVFLPHDFCYTYRPDPSFKWSLISTVNMMTSQYHKRVLRRIMEKGKYDFIHLNSLVLHSLIDADFPCIIHIRDIYDGSNPACLQNIRKAAGVIFIDEATRTPFREAGLERSIVLNNPFDMTPLAEYRDAEGVWPEKDFRGCVIFSIIGSVTEKKGIDFIIRCFLKVPNRNARLLIVGKGEAEYYSFCRKMSAADSRILFWGEEQDILKIYSVSDYILRGEAYQCIGRTIYEGLYAGCAVIVPAEDRVQEVMFEYDTFKGDIYSYKPRDEEQLTALLDDLSRRKVLNRVYRSNVADYVRRFDAFVAEVSAAARVRAGKR
jgi:glycosyltransferase involved in cell wall biosynthesis